MTKSEDTALSVLMRYNFIPPTPLIKGGFSSPPLLRGAFPVPPLLRGAFPVPPLLRGARGDQTTVPNNNENCCKQNLILFIVFFQENHVLYFARVNRCLAISHF